MLKYVFNTDLEDDEPMMFCAEEQCWDDATLKQLREEHNIIFMTNGRGVMPIMIHNKDSKHPLLAIGSEDDGTIYFERKYGQITNTFSPYWVEYLIADLEEALRVCNKTT